MAYSEFLTGKIRNALAHLPDVQEKKMFGSLCFMVNGKLCLTAGPQRMMCRIDPELHQREANRKGCETVIMRGREYKGYIYVSEELLQDKGEFDHWVNLALAFNETLTSEDS